MPDQPPFDPPSPTAPPPPPSGGYVPPPPPPGGGWSAPPPAAAPLPWDERNRIGVVPAFGETLKLLITRPVEAWARTRESGDLAGPVLFSVAVSWAGVALSSVWGLAFGNPWLALLPPEMRERFGGALAAHTGALLIQVAVAPIVLLIALFVYAAIQHVSFLVVGALSQSTSGFEGTVRVLAYSSVADLANAVPIVGGLAALVWKIVLMTLGATRLHRTSQGKAIFGILLPLVLCCVCVVGAIAVAVGWAFTAFSHR